MADLNILLRRMDQRKTEAGALERAAAALLAGMVVLLVLGSLF